MLVFKPIRWQTLQRDVVVIMIGFALFGLSIALLIQANLGTSPWVMLAVALANILGLTPGTLTVMIGMAVLAVSVALKERIGWGTLANILCIGPWVDLFLWLIPMAEENLPLQIAMLLASILIMGLATAIYIGVNAGAGPRDSLMLAIERISRWSLRRTRGTIELSVFILGWLLGGPFGIGTIVVVLLIGQSVQWGFRLLKVDVRD